MGRAVQKPHHTSRDWTFSFCPLSKVSFERFLNKKPLDFIEEVLVPGTGFEPAHGFPRCDLNTVRLPISPPGRAANVEGFAEIKKSGVGLNPLERKAVFVFYPFFRIFATPI